MSDKREWTEEGWPDSVALFKCARSCVSPRFQVGWEESRVSNQLTKILPCIFP